MKEKQKTQSFLLFAASLFVGVVAVGEIGVGIASADAESECVFEFSEPFYSRDANGINVGGTLQCRNALVYNQTILTLELWYQKFDPSTGRYTATLGCSNQTMTQQHYLVGNQFTCQGVPSSARYQLRGIGTGYNGNAQEFHVEDKSQWWDL